MSNVNVEELLGTDNLTNIMSYESGNVYKFETLCYVMVIFEVYDEEEDADKIKSIALEYGEGDLTKIMNILKRYIEANLLGIGIFLILIVKKERNLVIYSQRSNM